MPVGRSVVGSFSIISHADCIKVCITMDKAVMASTNPLAEIFKKNLDAMLTDKWR